MQFALTGPFLAYRRYKDDKILIRRIDKPIEANKNPPKADFVINLSVMFKLEQDINFVNFFSVPNSAFVSVKFIEAEGKIK